MKHTIRKLLSLVLVLATMSTLMLPAFAATTDTLTLDASHEEGIVAVDSSVVTPFFVLAKITNARGVTVTNDYDITYRWVLNDRTVSMSNYFEFPSGMETTAYTLTCTVTATHKADRTVLSNQLTWYPTLRYQKNIDLTINENVGNFYFTDTATQSGASVYTEILNALDLRSTYDLSAYTVSFVPNSNQIITYNGPVTCKLSELDKVFLTVNNPGTWLTQYTVYQGESTILSGLLTITVEAHLGLDVIYSAVPGENVVISTDDIMDFWYNNAGGWGALQYVYVNSVSGVSGIVCYDHAYNEKSHTSAFNTIMYANPTSNYQKGLEDLTFVPHKIGNQYPTGTVTISITAIGVDQKNNPIHVTGSFLIFYANSHPETITYECTGGNVMLDVADFDAVYRAVTGNTAQNPAYSIRFLDVPTLGTLYRGYEEDNFGSLVSTPVNSGNIDTLTFSSHSVGENAISRVAYVPLTPGKETIRYVVYSGTKILYVGSLTFSSREFVVTYTISSDSPLTFSSLDFYASGSPLLNAQFILFGNPTSGTLYKDYESKTRVQSYDYFSFNTAYGVNLLDNVTFVPKEGFSGVVEIPFAGQALAGGAVSGKVRIYVVKDAFEDVDSDNWAAPYINRLYATGIISGTSATTFSPDDNMTYGAALKMILNAAGYPRQSETGGAHWASNYLALAYREGIVNSLNVDLDAAVDRDTIAEIAARALGLDLATGIDFGVIGPVDSTNGYVYALYNAGILNGSFGADGRNYYYGSEKITRAQVAKIICMINDYIM